MRTVMKSLSVSHQKGGTIWISFAVNQEIKARYFPSVDYIGKDNAVRFIDVFVDDLEMSALGFQRNEPAWTGRRPYDPRDLLKLLRVSQSDSVFCKLERETHRNVEVMWLLRRLRPDQRRANFRKDNPKAFKGVFRAFTAVCRRLSLFGGELIAVDGSKFKAVNAPQRNFTKDKLKRRLQEIEEKIERYLQELDAEDAQDAEASSASSEAGASIQEKMQHLERKVTYTHLLDDLEARGETQVSLTDPDSRAMPPKWDTMSDPYRHKQNARAERKQNQYRCKSARTWTPAASLQMVAKRHQGR